MTPTRFSYNDTSNRPHANWQIVVYCGRTERKRARPAERLVFNPFRDDFSWKLRTNCYPYEVNSRGVEQNANQPDHVRPAPSPEGSVTRLVNRIGAGELASHDAMVPAVYEVLKQIARQRAAESDLGWRATELVHEAFLKLFGSGPVAFDSRAHFYGSAARAMQQLLINTAKSAHHRYTVEMPREELAGGLANGETVEGKANGVPRVDRSGSLDVSLVASAIEELAAQDGPLAELARLRIFAGLSTVEVARTLNISEHRAEREWTLAKAWISRKVRAGGG